MLKQTQADEALLALVTQAQSGQPPEPSETPQEPIAENADQDPADPNEHDMNAVGALHVATAYKAALHLIQNHGGSGELHNAVVNGLTKLHAQHQDEYKAHASNANYGEDSHQDVAHSSALDMHRELGQHLGLNK